MFQSNKDYTNDISIVSEDFANLNIRNKRFLIFGASGLIGRFLIDVLMYANKKYDLNNIVIGVGRNREKLVKIFSNYVFENSFSILEMDINQEISDKITCDYILQAASNTHPKLYATDPVGTITTNIIGTQNILEFARKKKVERTIFFSSVEIYGENRQDVKYFDESYMGYIDCNTLRAGYSEAKRTSEALCQAYISKHNLDIVIARISRVFGPTVDRGDSKASTQFIFNGVNNQNVTLKSKGDQLFSYSYVADVASALLMLIVKGIRGEAYNIKGLNGDVTLKQFAESIASYSSTKVIFELPDELEKKGFSTATLALLDDKKIRSLGWTPKFDFNESLEKTVMILKEELF
ncbi:NAD-dependent epimerase/dehydratase family protein [Enterococcus gilvus]|uniref:NAD-dependent epimerase/dehydratase family protein n=1 Tax=Enterococcus gilvus TaxID=160453 RepID=UPI003D6B9F02